MSKETRKLVMGKEFLRHNHDEPAGTRWLRTVEHGAFRATMLLSQWGSRDNCFLLDIESKDGTASLHIRAVFTALSAKRSVELALNAIGPDWAKCWDWEVVDPRVKSIEAQEREQLAKLQARYGK